MLQQIDMDTMKAQKINLIIVFVLVSIACTKEIQEPIVIQNKQAICEIIYPEDGEVYPEGITTKISGKFIAFDVDTNFVQVDVYLDGEYKKTIDQFPEGFGHYRTISQLVPLNFQLDASGVMPGQHSIEVRLIDSVGYVQDEVSIVVHESAMFESVKDFDGNEYSTVRIGDQIWFTSNLITTHLNDGTLIKEIVTGEDWSKNYKPYISWYTRVENPREYGAQYNFKVVKTGKICPQGWRVPSKSDWQALVKYIDEKEGPFHINIKGNQWPEIAKYLKTISDWNTGSTNSYAFSLRPTPMCDYNRNYQIPSGAVLWSSTQGDNSSQVYTYWFGANDNTIKQYTSYGPGNGICIRCMKDSIANN